MCKNCGVNMCGGCQSNGSAGSSAQQAAQISSLTNIVNTLTQSLGAFLNGHPIIAFENASDIALFDLTTGVGSGYLANWAICNGSSYLNPNTNLNVLTPNLLDKCLIQATGTYAVDAVTGNATQTLNVAQLPTHTHGVTDPGHTHGITDPGHTHGIIDPEHQHVIGGGIPVTASGSTTGNSGHTHNAGSSASVQVGGTQITPAFAGGGPGYGGGFCNTENSHTHTVSVTGVTGTGATNTAATGVSVQDAFTGESINSATTGITIGNTGSNNSFSVMQPSYAVLYAMKIY